LKILILSTWFPYPTNQGSKTRAYHLIRGLSREHAVALLSFQDTTIHAEWINHMKGLCEHVTVVPQHPFQYNRWKTRLGFFSLKPSAVFAGYFKAMSSAVAQFTQQWQPDLVFALTFVTAPYALEIADIPRVVDMDNLLARMLYERYQQSANLTQRLRRYLAYWKFRRYEDQTYSRFNLALVCSQLDVSRAQEYIRIKTENILCVPNGVDFQSIPDNPGRPAANSLIFNGALTYEPNFDAMRYFLGEIFPLILAKNPHAHLTITGKTDGVPINRLPRFDGHVQFSGYIEDIHAAVASSMVCVAPLRQGAGTRLKILEAMAVATPVVSTSKGAEGLEVKENQHILIGDTPQQFAEQTLRLMSNEEIRSTIVKEAQTLVKTSYDWMKIGASFAHKINALQRNLK
jgi:glycosyltransferase involved in cell wall biosynthesis